MEIFSAVTLCGGLAFFLFGMHLLSGRLEKMAGARLESLLKKTKKNRLRGLLLGAAITVGIQSSSAVTVLLVGLVNSGIMKLGQSVPVIMGSNVGTTVTAWLTGLSGIESDQPFMHILKPEFFSPIIALLGVIFMMSVKSDRKKSVGTVMIGFSILMEGMEMMKEGVEVFSENPIFLKIIYAFNNPVTAVLVGLIFTGLIQSSAASVGVLQALAMNGCVTCSMAIPIVMGQNIGTCLAPLISSSKGANKNAQRVSVIHVMFNIIGTAICLLIYCIVRYVFKPHFLGVNISGFGIALIHSAFNVVTVVILFPFSKLLEKLAYRIVSDKEDSEKDEVYSFMDMRLLSTPSVAISECSSKCKDMAQIAESTIIASIGLLKNYDEKVVEEILKNEDMLDLYEDKIGTYLVKLSGKELSDPDSRSVSRQLHTIGDFERIGDHAVNIYQTAEEMKDKQITLVPGAEHDISVLLDALQEIVSKTTKAYVDNDIELAKDVEPLEETVDGLIEAIKTKHVKRRASGDSSIEFGFILADLLTNCERVSDHCSNIAVAIIETAQMAFDTHKYMDTVKHSGNEEFESRYEMYKKKYSLDQQTRS